MQVTGMKDKVNFHYKSRCLFLSFLRSSTPKSFSLLTDVDHVHSLFIYSDSFDAIRTIVTTEGLRGLYTGLSECDLVKTLSMSLDDLTVSLVRRQSA